MITTEKELIEIFGIDGVIPPTEPCIEGVDCDSTVAIGFEDPEWQAKYNGGYSPNNPFKDPEFQRTMPRHSKGVITAEAHKMGGVASTSIKYKCNECDMISTVGGITSHIKSSGHIGYERLVNGNKTR